MRRKVIWVSGELMLDIFRLDTRRTAFAILGMPDDAKLVDVFFNPVNYTVGFQVESDTFPEAKDYGSQFPRLELEIKRYEATCTLDATVRSVGHN